MVIDTARAIAATVQPVTGDRATGTATFFATGADVELPRNEYLIPRIGGQIRPDLLMKTGKGPGLKADSPNKTQNGYWTVTSAGTAVEVISNVGGKDMNLAAGTELGMEFVINGITPQASIDSPGMDNGTSPDKGSFGFLQSVQIYENFSGPTAGLDAFRARMKRFPAMMIAWVDTVSADGTTTAQTTRTTRVGTTSVLYKETYNLIIMTARDDHDHLRRLEGLEAMERVTNRITDTNSVDGICFSNPGAIEIRSRAPLPVQTQEAWQQFYVYAIQVSAMSAITRTDDRVYNPWLLTTMILQTPDNELPNQGEFDVVDTSFDMPQQP